MEVSRKCKMKTLILFLYVLIIAIVFSAAAYAQGLGNCELGAYPLGNCTITTPSSQQPQITGGGGGGGLIGSGNITNITKIIKRTNLTVNGFIFNTLLIPANINVIHTSILEQPLSPIFNISVKLPFDLSKDENTQI